MLLFIIKSFSRRTDLITGWTPLEAGMSLGQGLGGLREEAINGY